MTIILHIFSNETELCSKMIIQYHCKKSDSQQKKLKYHVQIGYFAFCDIVLFVQYTDHYKHMSRTYDSSPLFSMTRSLNR